MALPPICGEFGIVAEPEIRFTEGGNSWAKLRVVAKDRGRDANGAWTDKDPMFIDVLVGQGAENLIETVSKGDSIIVIGKLKSREWEKDGVKQTSFQISAEHVGVSTRWNPWSKAAKGEAVGSAAVARETLGGSDLPPF